jgi:hypothetical protein
MRVGIMIVGAALTMYVGAKVVASYSLTEMTSNFARDAKGICMVRGSNPTAETMTARLEALAVEAGVRIENIQVASESLAGSKHSGIEAQMQGTLNKMSAGKLKMSGTLLRATAHIQAKKWLWEEDKDISTKCVIKRQMRRIMPLPPR